MRINLALRITLALIGILTMAAVVRLPGAPEPTDFAVFYTAAKQAGKTDIYSLDQISPMQRELGLDPRPFIRPPFHAVMLKPFTALPFDAALPTWRVLSLLACFGFVVFWPGDRMASALAVCWSAPLWDAFAAGQDTPFLLMLLSLSLAMLERRPLAAGLVISLCFIKFHLFALLPVFLFEKRLWKTAAGIGCGLLAEMALSSLTMPSWISSMLRSAFSAPANAMIFNMFNLRGMVSGLPGSLFWELLSGALMAGVCWLTIRRSSLTTAFTVMLAGGMMISYHAYLYDALLCLPLALQVFRTAENAIPRIAALVVMLPTTYFLASLPALVHLPKLLIVALILYLFLESSRRAGGQRPSGCDDNPAAPRI